MTVENDLPATWSHEESTTAGAACLEAALSYLDLGWSVLCLCPPDHAGVGKSHGASCDPHHWGKRPLANGSRWKEFQERRATENEVRRWWHENPYANVGCALGPVSGLVRLDVEGEAAKARLFELSGGDLPPTLAFTSGKPGAGGLLYGLPPGVLARTGVEGMADGELRIQGLGSQTVLPPSRHRSGRSYVWVPGRSPADLVVAPAPVWLLDRLARGQEASPRTALADGEIIPAGQCDTILTRMAGAMRRHGFTADSIEAALEREIHNGRCETESGKRAYDRSDAVRISRSVGRYEPDAYANMRPLPMEMNGVAAGHPLAVPSFGPPVPASMLRALADDAKWLWKGYLSRGGITLLSSLWKAGKTTLQTYLLKAFGSAGFFCGADVQPARVLYVTEEHEAIWADRRDEVRFGDWVEFLIRPFGTKPDMKRWLEFLAYLQEICPEKKYDLIVFDTISNLWPVKDENDAAKVQEALMPMRAVSDLTAFLLNHHMRKGDGTEATASRGSGALPAFVDTILELRRFDALDRKDRRRVLTGYGRYQETPAEVVLELAVGGYQCLGERKDVKARDVGDVLASLMPTATPGVTTDQLIERWPDDTTPRRRNVLHALTAGFESGRWFRTGTGHKGDPYLFWCPRDSVSVPHVYRQGTETESETDPDDMPI